MVGSEVRGEAGNPNGTLRDSADGIRARIIQCHWSPTCWTTAVRLPRREVCRNREIEVKLNLGIDFWSGLS